MPLLGTGQSLGVQNKPLISVAIMNESSNPLNLLGGGWPPTICRVFGGFLVKLFGASANGFTK